MNVLNSHCMNSLSHIKGIASLVACAAITLIGCAELSAQNQSGMSEFFKTEDIWGTPLALRNGYQVDLQRNPWFRGHNINGIRFAQSSRAYAELDARYEGGSYRSNDESVEQWGVGAVTEGIRHFNTISLQGSFSFDHTQAYGMCGSMMLNPGYYPVDLVEFVPGRKTRQTYTVSGGISASVAPNWLIGVNGDFMSTNWSKLKDLRYTNYGLDFSLSPSFLYYNSQFKFGLSYTFQKVGETIKAEQIGTGKDTYYAFLNKGNHFGIYQSWEGSGVHLSEFGVNGFPVKEFGHDISLQLGYKDFYAEAGFVYAHAKMGERDTEWFDAPTFGVHADLAWSLQKQNIRHQLALNFEWKYQYNIEHVLDKSVEGGVTIVEDYGQNRIFARDHYILIPQYGLYTDKFRFGAEARIDYQASIGTQVYPFFNREHLLVGEMVLSASWLLPRGFEIGCSLAGSKGYDKLSCSNERPESLFYLESWHKTAKEYLTSARITSQLSLKWKFWRGMYASVQATCRAKFHAPVDLPGRVRTLSLISLGYEF